MAPLTHLFLAYKVTQKEDANLLFGSVIPDIAWTSQRRLDHDKIHNKPGPDTFLAFIEKSYPQMRNIAIGVQLHSNENGGDFYSHHFDNKYSYRLGRELLPEVAQLLNFDDPEMGVNIAHNFIEGALDLHVLSDEPKILDIYRQVIDKTDVQLVSKVIAEYMQIDKTKVEHEIKFFIKLFGPESVSSEDAMTEKFFMQWIRIAYQKGVEAHRVAALIHRAKTLTNDSYRNLLETATNNMRKDFGKVIITL